MFAVLQTKKKKTNSSCRTHSFATRICVLFCRKTLVKVKPTVCTASFFSLSLRSVGLSAAIKSAWQFGLPMPFFFSFVTQCFRTYHCRVFQAMFLFSQWLEVLGRKKNVSYPPTYYCGGGKVIFTANMFHCHCVWKVKEELQLGRKRIVSSL